MEGRQELWVLLLVELGHMVSAVEAAVVHTALVVDHELGMDWARRYAAVSPGPGRAEQMVALPMRPRTCSMELRSRSMEVAGKVMHLVAREAQKA